VSRFLFFVLLIAVLAMGAHLWINAPKGAVDVSSRERNANDITILAVTPPDQAARAAEETRKTVSALAGAACVQLSGIPAADLARARQALSALALGDRLAEQRVEDVSRYWVFVPPARDRRAAEVTVAQLRRQGVTDAAIRPDNAISLGVYSSEEAARRFLAQLETRGVHEAEVAPFARELREVVMLVREPDTEAVARLTILQRDFPSSQLRAVTCPTG
jgi:hypothetical protein